MRYLFLLLITMLVSCGDITTNDGTGNDSDKPWFSDDSRQDDDQEFDDENNESDKDLNITDHDDLFSDDIEENDDDSDSDNEDVPDSEDKKCGNSIIDEGEFCDSQFINCVEIDSQKYIGGKAKCLDDCSGWDTGWCDSGELNECINGEKECSGNSSYIVCGNYDSDVYSEWSAPIICENGKICENGVCLCEPHHHSVCENSDSYWYNSCGEKEELKKDCGNDGYSGGQYCKNGHVYQLWMDRGCSNGECTEESNEEWMFDCGNYGCVDGECDL